MKTYIITIINLKTNTVHNLERTEDSIDECIKKELGGWSNLYGAMTSRQEIDDDNYQHCGTTRDNRDKMWSILCYNKK